MYHLIGNIYSHATDLKALSHVNKALRSPKYLIAKVFGMRSVLKDQ